MRLVCAASDVALSLLPHPFQPQGVLLKHRLSYLGYKLSIPVFLVPSLRPKVVICALLAPPLVFLALEKLALGPIARRRKDKVSARAAPLRTGCSL